LLLGTFGSPARGQTATTGAVHGVVRDSEGELVPDALITLVDARSGERHQTIATRGGEYRLVRLPAGDYSVIGEQIGYAPAFVTGVPVRAGIDLDLPLVLRTGSGADLVVDSAGFAVGAAALGRAAASRWFASATLEKLPFSAPELAGLSRLVSWLDPDLGAEGLPASFTTLALEGHLFRSASHPLLGGRTSSALIPPSALGGAEVTRAAVDVEWKSAAGTVAGALARRGTEYLSGELAGQGSAGPLATSGFFEEGSLSPRLLRGSAVLEGAAFSDSARFVIGGVIRSDERAFSPAWANNEANAAIAEAGGWIGRLSANLEPQLLSQQSLAGFAQLNWRIASTQRLGLTFAAAQPPDQLALAPSSGMASLVEGADLLAGLTLFTDLGSAGNQLRLSWASSRRESFGVNPTAVGVMVPDALRLNGSEGARVEESTIRVLDAIHLRAGGHDLKVGGDIALVTHDQLWRPGAVAEYLFGGLDQLQQSVGAYRQTIGTVPALNWTGREYGGFLQDSWQGETGLGITVALRAERYDISDTPARDNDWFDLTEAPNDLPASSSWRFSPRLDVSWLVGEERQFQVNAAAGLFNDRVDPLVVAQWLLDDGSADVARHVGNVGVWTVGRPSAATTRQSLTLPGTALRGPETLKAVAGFAYAPASGTTFALDAGYRHTRFLPRRDDLNQLPAQLAQDQYGRPVFGTLMQQGGLVTAVPGSNRRFPEYDVVTALNLDGWSTWYGGSARVERILAGAFSLGASYTYSRTRDNWFGAAAGGGLGEIAPHLGQNADWAEADSDFDVPHRGAVYAAWTSPVGLEVGGVFRYQSGRPFTAGFPWGTDVNGDGVTGNDPAFVDPAVAGMDAVLSRWSCLQQASGGFVERNSCRGDATTTLDARAAFRLPDFGGVRLSATAEAIDLLETDFAMPDAALYRIDPGQSLVHNGAERTVAVPLLVNPGFGEPLVRPRTGRSIRVGLALTW